MAKSKSQIIADIEEHIEDRGGELDQWYVGIAAKPRERVFSDHAVDEKTGKWIWRRASSSAVAREIEKHFLELGAAGGTGGGNDETEFVYAYRITPDTVE